MADGPIHLELRRLRTPRAAAVAGILFAALFATSLVLMRSALPNAEVTDTSWVTSGADRMRLALTLAPFAGIAFLWFVGVIRDRLGEFEDRFFATVFYGSGLLFLAMIFVSMSIAGGILASAEAAPDLASQQDVVTFGRAVMLQISNVYALRMAAVFMISLATIWLRTGILPRWLAVLTYGLAAALLLVVSLNLWVTLVFPLWAFVVSITILVHTRHAPAAASA